MRKYTCKGIKNKGGKEMAKKGADLLITLTHHESDPNNVTIALTMGWEAAKKGLDVELVLLSNGVYVVAKDYPKYMDIGEPFKPVSELLDLYREAGGKIKVCTSCMKHNRVEPEDLIDGCEMITAVDVVDSIMAAEKTLQLN